MARPISIIKVKKVEKKMRKNEVGGSSYFKLDLITVSPIII